MYELSEKRVSCLGVVGGQYKFPEKDFILTPNSYGARHTKQINGGGKSSNQLVLH